MYPGECLIHHLQGIAIACVMVLDGDAQALTLALLWVITYIAYQGYTRMRKGDSAGLDVADLMMGLIPGYFVLEFLGWLLG